MTYLNYTKRIRKVTIKNTVLYKGDDLQLTQKNYLIGYNTINQPQQNSLKRYVA